MNRRDARRRGPLRRAPCCFCRVNSSLRRGPITPRRHALLEVVALAAVVICTMNTLLAFAGESGTLLFPSRGELPAVLAAGIDVTPAATGSVAVTAAANDAIRTAA